MREPEEARASPPKMVVCVGAVVLQDESVLLVRQAEGHSLAGQWSIPWGFVDSGESPKDAALRETHEEGGITAEIEGLLGVQELPEAGWLGIVFLCRHVEGVPQPDGRETDSAGYFSLEELDSLDGPIETWCEWLSRRVLSGDYQTIPGKLDNPYCPRNAFL